MIGFLVINIFDPCCSLDSEGPALPLSSEITLKSDSDHEDGLDCLVSSELPKLWKPLEISCECRVDSS
jgi:hypothetical protein